MHKRWTILALVAVLAVGGAIGLLGKRRTQNTDMPQAVLEKMNLPQPMATPAVAEGEAQKEEMPDGGGYFVVQTYAGKIAVYRIYADGTRAIAQILDTEVCVLPEKDIESLGEGIVVRSKEALTKLLEDFTS